MLVLSRKEDETIYIGNSIKITVLSIRGSVRIGIDAPADVKILRGELSPTQESNDAEIQFDN